MRLVYGLLASLIIVASASAADIKSSVRASDLPKDKQTTLGLYLSSTDAATALKADPKILFLDTRDPIEVMFVGHPVSITAVVPFILVTHEFDEKNGSYKEVPNPSFLKNVQDIVGRAGAGKSHPIFVMCRSGGRSAAAVNALAKAGYTNAWSLVEGFEGDKDKEGKRSVNGWDNAGLPWAYKLTASQAWTPSK